MEIALMKELPKDPGPFGQVRTQVCKPRRALGHPAHPLLIAPDCSLVTAVAVVVDVWIGS